jgi:hypothetical protein
VNLVIWQIRIFDAIQYVKREVIALSFDELHMALGSQPVEYRIYRGGDGIDPARKAIDDLTDEFHRSLVAICG